MVDMVVDTNRDESFWVSYIKRRIKQNKNFIGIVSGPTGSGKSWSALSIAKMLNPDFDVDQQVIFKGKDFLVRVNKFKRKGLVIIWDEAGIDLSNRNWMSRANKTINFVIQTFRHQNFILLFTVPYSDFIDKQTRRLFHAELKTVSINFDDNTCKLKPQLIQYNQRYGKFYYKRLRVRKNKGGVVPLNNWSVPAPPKELTERYEIIKKEYTAMLNYNILKEWEKDEQKQEHIPMKRKMNPLQLMIAKAVREGKRSLDEIAEYCSRSRNTISASLKSMERNGYSLENRALAPKLP